MSSLGSLGFISGFRRYLRLNPSIRNVTCAGIAVGFLDVVTTAEHLLVGPMNDGNPLLMALGQVAPVVAYGAFVLWFCLVAAVAVSRADGIGYGADVYLFAAFGVAGAANMAYFLTGTMVFKTFVGEYPLAMNVYQFLVAPLGSLVVGFAYRQRTKPGSGISIAGRKYWVVPIDDSTRE